MVKSIFDYIIDSLVPLFAVADCCNTGLLQRGFQDRNQVDCLLT